MWKQHHLVVVWSLCSAGPRAKGRSLKELPELGILNFRERGFLRPQLGFEARFPPSSRHSCLTEELFYESRHPAEAVMATRAGHRWNSVWIWERRTKLERKRDRFHN